VKSAGTNIAIAGNGDFQANNSALVVEQMFALKEERSYVLRKIRYFRTKMRFPVPEAAYRGNWQIIHRIHARRLFHFNFSYSWIFPAPPPPFIRVIPKYVYIYVCVCVYIYVYIYMSVSVLLLHSLTPPTPHHPYTNTTGTMPNHLS
jgi:hypothetical protein